MSSAQSIPAVAKSLPKEPSQNLAGHFEHALSFRLKGPYGQIENLKVEILVFIQTDSLFFLYIRSALGPQQKMLRHYTKSSPKAV